MTERESEKKTKQQKKKKILSIGVCVCKVFLNGFRGENMKC